MRIFCLSVHICCVPCCSALVLSRIHLPADCSTVDHCSHTRYTLLPFVGFLFWELFTFHWYVRQTHHVWSYFKLAAGPFLPFDIHMEFPLFQVCFCIHVVHRDGIAANRESYRSPVTDAELAGRLQWGDFPWEKLIQFRAEFLDLGWVRLKCKQMFCNFSIHCSS